MGMTTKGILQMIVETRPANRAGNLANRCIGEEIININYGLIPEDTKPVLKVIKIYDYHKGTGANTKTARAFRKGKRRMLKRQEQRAAAKDIQSQLQDMHDEANGLDVYGQVPFNDDYEYLTLMAIDALTEHLHNDDNWLFVNSSATHIEVAMCGGDDSWFGYSEELTTRDDHDLNHMIRHASHLPEKHIVDADYMISIDGDVSDSEVIMADPTGLRLGSKLSQSGSVYGKARRQHMIAA